jgi:8-oxo-dGTP diphosphatase
MRLNAEFEFSAGGIIKDKNKILIINLKDPSGRQVWTFPKGKIEKGESAADAASREVYEETGYSAELISSIGETGYFFNRADSIVIKKVFWFLMADPRKKAECETGISEAAWMSYADVLKALDYRSDIGILNSQHEEFNN